MSKSKDSARHTRRIWRAFLLLCHILVGAVATQTVLRGSRTILPRTTRQRNIVRWWMRRLCDILGMKVTVHGLRPSGGVLLVANHISWLDIPAAMSVIDVDFVSKHDVLKWPLIGAMAKRAGTIFIVRGGYRAASTATDQIAARLQQPYNVIVFPEGTTTDGTIVRRFHARLYQAAVQTSAPIQALAFRYPGHHGAQGVAPFVGNDTLVTHLWRLLSHRRLIVELHFCEPVSPADDRRALAERTRETICRVLEVDIEAPSLRTDTRSQ